MELIPKEYVREKVLSKCRDKFIADFEFGDIHRDLSNANVLPLTELDTIARSPSKEEQVDKLFFLLVIRGDDTYNAFKFQLRAKYGWLLRAIEAIESEEQSEYQIRDYQSRNYGKIRDLHKELPKFVDYNIHRCELVMQFGIISIFVFACAYSLSG